MLDSGALLLIRTGCSTAAQANGNGLLDPQYAASMHTTPQSTTLGLHPVIHVPNYMDRYSLIDP